MATADQIKALIRSHAEGDERRFFSIALQVGLLAADYPETRLGDMVLDDTIRGRLERVIAEHRQRERLFLGPAGGGKTHDRPCPDPVPRYADEHAGAARGARRETTGQRLNRSERCIGRGRLRSCRP